MQNYTPILDGRRVVMISDFVSKDYDDEDKAEEKDFLDKISDDLSIYNIDFDFIEVKDLVELADELKKYDKQEIVVFNWCEEIEEKANTGHLVTEFLETNGYFFTGANTANLKLGMNKLDMYKLLSQNEVTIPKIYTFDGKIGNFKFPVIVKAIYEHGSYKLTDDSILKNIDDFHKIKEIIDCDKFYMEEFIEGREFVITMCGQDKAEIFPITELIFDPGVDTKFNIQNSDSKWKKDSNDYKHTYAKISNDLEENLTELINGESSKVFGALQGCGLCRLEMRLNSDIPYVIDVNPNPNFRPNTSLMISAMAQGYNEGLFVARLCEYALQRTG